MNIIKNIRYGAFPDNDLDLYLPDSDSFDLFMYMHAGGLEFRNKERNTEIFTYLAEHGIAAAPINYRKYPTAKYPDFIEDGAAAAAWLKKNISKYGKCRRIFLGGSSAGGYISMMLCFDARWLGIHNLKNTDFAGFIMDAGQPTTHFKVLKEYGIDTRRNIVDDKAPLYHIGTCPAHPPMYIIVSDNDLPCRLEQTQLMIAALRQFGCPEDALRFEIKSGKHIHYVDTLSENGDSVFGKMVFDYIQSL